MAHIKLAKKGHPYFGYQGWNTTINTKRIVEVKNPNLHTRGGCSLTLIMRKSKKKNNGIFFSRFPHVERPVVAKDARSHPCILLQYCA